VPVWFSIAAVDFWAVSGWVVGVIGLGIGMVAWLRPRRIRRQLGWWFESEEVVRDDFAGGISISVDGVVVTRLSQTTVTFINRGDEAIRQDEVVATSSTPASELSITIPNSGQLLRYRFDVADYPHVLPRGRLEGDACFVSWQILEPGDVLNVALLHAGNASAVPVVNGHIADGRIRNVQAERDELAHTIVDLIGSTSLSLTSVGSATSVLRVLNRARRVGSAARKRAQP
jgi:hypothetical protein